MPAACTAPPSANTTTEQLRAALAKRVANIKARAALAGIVAHESVTDDGRLEVIVSRWSLCRAFTDLDELGRWLDRVSPKLEGTS